MVLKNFNSDQKPTSVSANGKEIKTFDQKNIHINQFPSKVIVKY
jgi:hypothetical protein